MTCFLLARKCARNTQTAGHLKKNAWFVGMAFSTHEKHACAIQLHLISLQLCLVLSQAAFPIQLSLSNGLVDFISSEFISFGGVNVYYITGDAVRAPPLCSWRS
jgi:hypothetical protein